MTLRLRRKLFAFFVALFLVGGVCITLYSQGYRIDTSSWEITKTGAVYIESRPKDPRITLNAKEYKNKSSLLRSGTLITNIIPKRYRLVLSKEGYYGYEKNIEVTSASVARVLHATLVPLSLASSTATTSEKISSLTSTQEGTLIGYSTKGSLLALDSIAGTATNISTRISPFFKSKIKNIVPYGQGNDTFLVYTTSGLYRVNTKSKEITQITTDKSISSIQIRRNNAYWISHATSSVFVIYDLTLNNIASRTILQEPSSVRNVIISDNWMGLIDTQDDLWLGTPGKSGLVKLAHDAAFASFSPDETKLFFQDNDGKAFVYLLSDDKAGLEATKGTTIPLSLINAGRIEKRWWYKDSYHLFLLYQDGSLVFAEITDQEPNNHYTIARNINDVIYEEHANALYGLVNENVILTLPFSL